MSLIINWENIIAAVELPKYFSFVRWFESSSDAEEEVGWIEIQDILIRFWRKFSSIDCQQRLPIFYVYKRSTSSWS